MSVQDSRCRFISHEARMRRPTPPPVVKKVAFGTADVTIGRITAPLAGAQLATANDLMNFLGKLDAFRTINVRYQYSLRFIRSYDACQITPLAGDGSALTDLTVDASSVSSVRLAFRDDIPRRRIAAKDNRPVDPETEAVSQRLSLKTLVNRLELEEGSVVRLIEAIDSDWLLGECRGLKGRFLRTALLDNDELSFEAEWHETPYAQWDLGWRYLEGWSGLVRDEVRGVEWIKRAAAQDHTQSLYTLSGLRERGGLTRDKDASARILEMCAARKHPFAQYDLAYIILKKQTTNAAAAIPLFMSAAEQGLVGAMNYLGYCHQKGMGVDLDLEMAVYWYTMAIEQGDPTSMHELANLYRQDLHDTPMAIEWLQKAVAIDYNPAMHELAKLHLNEDEYRDVSAAIMLLTRAANRGYIKSTQLLARHFYDCRDYDTAVMWYEKAAEDGDPTAAVWVKRCYRVMIDTTDTEKLP